MANRYKNQNYGRGYENRGGYGDRSSNYDRSESEYGEGRYGWSDSSDRYSEDDDREGNYAGGRRAGRGMRGSESRGGYGSSNREHENDYSAGSPPPSNRGDHYGRERRRGGMNDDEFGERGEFRRGYRGYSGNYPESESGFDLERDEERGWLEKASDEVSSWLGDEEATRRRRGDAHRQGSHRGRGPRNYTRSDERIREDINDRLTDHDYLDASDIEVEVGNGEVILTGTVESRYAKRLAEDIAEDVSGVKNVENRLRIGQRSHGQRNSSLTGQPLNAGMNDAAASSQGMPDRVSGSTGLTSSASSLTGSTETGETDDTTTGRSRGGTA